MTTRALAARTLLALLVVVACRKSPTPLGSAPSPAASAETPVETAWRVVRPFGDLSRCQVEHRGLFVDLAEKGSHARRSFRLPPFADLATLEAGAEGATRFLGRRTHYDFWLTQPTRALGIVLRARGGRARQLHVVVDDWRVGRVRLDSKHYQTLRLPPLKMALDEGRHQLHLRWSHATRGDGALGSIQWMFLGAPGEFSSDYPLPRRGAVYADVTLNEQPLPAVVLEAPGRLRCGTFPLAGSQLSVAVGYRGVGNGVARIVARPAGGPAVTLTERRVTGGPGARWTPLELDLSKLSGSVTQIELEAVSDSAQGQVAFGDPKIQRRVDERPLTPTRLAIVLVASGLHRELLPPFPSARGLPHFSALHQRSVRFATHRVPSVTTGSVVASLLSGLAPAAHGVRTAKARLPARVATLASRLERRSGESAMFTGVPATRAAFGFDRGFTRFEAYSPVNDVAATAPLSNARRWLEERLDADETVPRLLVVHLRGAHPPWDLSREEVARLDPREYHGVLEARRGGIILSSIRSRRRLSQRRLSTQDWVRLRALERAALEKQDAALGDLVATLSRRGQWQDALVVLVGDVASGDPPVAPFGEPRTLAEDHLVTPLWIKFPGEQAAGQVVGDPVGTTDVTRTIADALSLEPRDADEATLNLERLARGDQPPLLRALSAARAAEYSVRWGRWLLRGTSPAAPTLCDLAVDPSCAGDVFREQPVVAEAIWRETFARHRDERALDESGGATEPALIDEATAAALRVWGD